MAICPTCRRTYPDDVLTCEHDGDTLLPEAAFGAKDSEIQIGELIGEYRVEAELGKGGFGSVYKAVQPLIGKYVAIKVLHREFCSNPRVVLRFIAEARAVNQIRHGSIVDIFGFGTLPDGRHYFVMELLEGLTLRSYLQQRRRLSPPEAISLLRPIARALDAAHTAGIAHRDLKPDNVFLAVDRDGALHPKIIDFGIAKLFDQGAGTATMTRSGAPIGTPAYMSPEQCRGHDVDHRTDIYSFGVLTHEMLTGEPLFVANNVVGMYFHHTQTKPSPMSSTSPDLPKELDASVLRMLEKDPDERPGSLSEAVEELAKATEKAGFSVPAAGLSTPSRPYTRSVMAEAQVSNEATATRRAFASSRTRQTSRRGAPWLLSFCALSVCILGFVGLRAIPGRTKPGDAHAAASIPAQIAEPTLIASTRTPPAPISSASSGNDLIELRFQSVPRNVEIYNGKSRLGSSAEPLRVARSDQKLKLTIKADGYRATDVEVLPSRDAFVSVKLIPNVARGQKKPVRRHSADLENPF